MLEKCELAVDRAILPQSLVQEYPKRVRAAFEATGGFSPLQAMRQASRPVDLVLQTSRNSQRPKDD